MAQTAEEATLGAPNRTPHLPGICEEVAKGNRDNGIRKG